MAGLVSTRPMTEKLIRFDGSSTSIRTLLLLGALSAVGP